MKRGVVIAGLYDAFKAEKGWHITPSPLNASIVRSSLLYWDRIDIPDNDFARLPLSADYQPLIAEKIVTRRHISVYGSSTNVVKINGGSLINCNIIVDGKSIDDFAEKLKLVPLEAFNQLQQEKDTLWAYLKNNATASSPEEGSVNGRSLVLELYNKLPVPDDSVPFEKVLKFKSDRADELQALRSKLDELYIKISNAEDVQYMKAMAVDEIDLCIADLIRVSNESWTTKMIKSLKFEINPINMATISAAVIGYTGSITLGALSNFATCFKLDLSDTIFNKQLPPRLAPYKVALDVMDNLNAKVIKGD
jgi:hypothetical protein